MIVADLSMLIMAEITLSKTTIFGTSKAETNLFKTIMFDTSNAEISKVSNTSMSSWANQTKQSAHEFLRQIMKFQVWRNAKPIHGSPSKIKLSQNEPRHMFSHIAETSMLTSNTN